MKTFAVSSLLACAVMFLSSCYVYFTTPPFLTSECRPDGELLGSWERDANSPRDFSSKYRFTRRSDTVMDVWMDSDQVLAVTCRVGGSRYLVAWDPNEKVAGAPREYPGPYYAVAPYYIRDGKFCFKYFDLKKFGKLFQDKKLKGFSIGGGQWTPPSLYVTSPPAEARKAIDEKGFDFYIAKEGEWTYKRTGE